MKKMMKLLAVCGLVAVVTGCANKEIIPEKVTVNEVVLEGGMPQVYVEYHGTRYVNVHTLAYAQEAVFKKQAEVNEIAAKENESGRFFSK